MNGLEGRVVVVTGGARGIGAAVSTELAREGARVVVADVRSDAAEEAASTIPGAIGRSVDVTDSASVAALVAGVGNDLGRLDGWVNNAGIVENASVVDMPDEIWDRTISVNLTGTFYGCREAARFMVAHGGGSIVNISSISAFRGTRPEHHVAYDVSKAGVAHMAKVLAGELAGAGVRVNAVAPGYTDTEMVRNVGADTPEIMAEWLSQIPQRRLIQPVEIARTISFLLSDASSAITGQVVHADAGYTVW